jgi:vacuolar protein sorting-associated protein 18
LGIYHGTFNWQSTTENLVDNTQLFPYPTFPAAGSQGNELHDTPLSIALTEFHFMLLYKDRIAGVSTLDENLAYEEILPLVSVYQLRRSFEC